MRAATVALLVSLAALVSGSALAQKSISGPVGRAIPSQPIATPPPSHGHHHHRSVFVGGGFGFGYPWGWPYYYYPVPIYVEPVTYIEQGNDAPVEAERWWYYCGSSTSYYPYVRECPTGWERVPPR